MTDFPNDEAPSEEPGSTEPGETTPGDDYEPADDHAPTDDEPNDDHAPTDYEPTETTPGESDGGDATRETHSVNDGPSDDVYGPHMPPPFAPGPSAEYGAVPPMRRLYRSRDDRKLGGVSAGIAEFFGIDPTFVRLGTLVFAVTGVGILAYLAAWVVVPLRPEGLVEAPRVGPIADERSTTIAFGIAALALAFGIATGSWAVLALALVGGGVWLLSQHPTPTPAGYPPAAYTPGAPYLSAYDPAAYAPSADSPSAPHAYAPRQPLVDAGPYAATGGFPPPRSHEPERPDAEPVRQRITWTVLSILALVAAVGLAASTGDWWDVSATRFLGGALVIIAAGVVVGQVRGGGARGLIPLGLLAALALFPVSAVDGLINEGVGDKSFQPASLVELESSYEHGIGKMTIDLSQIDFEGQSETIDIDLGVGELIVIVSEDTGGRAVLSARAGEVSHDLPTRSSARFDEGLNVRTGTLALEGDDGELDLNISVGFGTAELRSTAD